MPDAQGARRNAVLDGLGEDQLHAVLQDCHEQELALGAVLYEPGVPVSAVHFPLVGVVSILADVDAQGPVEVATVGHEGVVGLSVFLGAPAPTERAVVQLAGRALTMSAQAFVRQMGALDGPLLAMLRRYTQAMFTQIARNAACNRVHPVRQRAARWLLMTADRMDGPTFDLTQEFLAQMLSVRRATVSEVAQELADDGVLTYSRGRITITDRDRLHASACDCYDVITAATRQALTGSSPAA